jgi:hypothetical protein
MTVSQLIEVLKTMPQEAMAVVRGYESGVNEIDGTEIIKVNIDANEGTWYYGAHEEVSQSEDGTEVVRIFGSNS